MDQARLKPSVVAEEKTKNTAANSESMRSESPRTNVQRGHSRRINSPVPRANKPAATAFPANKGRNEHGFAAGKLAQAYDQAPWRRQMQVIGTFLLVVVSVALIAGIYLNVTARAATIGRQIQDMQVRMGGLQRLDLAAQAAVQVSSLGEDAEPEEIPIEELKIQIADLEAELARLYSVETMLAKAEVLGFESIDPEHLADHLAYLEVPGYAGRPEANLAPPPEPAVAAVQVMPVAYRQSLLDWLKQGVIKTTEILPDQSELRDLLLGGVQR